MHLGPPLAGAHHGDLGVVAGASAASLVGPLDLNSPHNCCWAWLGPYVAIPEGQNWAHLLFDVLRSGPGLPST